MLRKILLLTAIIPLLFSMSCAKRSTEWQEPDVLDLVYQGQIVGNPLDLDCSANKVYVAQDQGGFSIIDLGDYSQKWYTSLISADGSTVPFVKIRKVSMVGEYNRLFLNETDGTDLIRIVDTTDPDSIKVIDAITGATQDISDMVFEAIPNPTTADIIDATYSSGTYVYPDKYDGNLWIGGEPSIHTPATASGFAQDASYIYVAAQQRGLMIYNKTNQQLVGQLAVTGEALKVAVKGNYAYVVAKQGGMHVVDVSNPASPQKVYTYDTTGYATSINISGNMAAVSSGGGGIYLFDITIPSQPALLTHLTSCGYTNNAKIYNGRLIVAARDQGILIYDIAD